MGSTLTANELVKKLFARINYEKQTHVVSDDFKLANITDLMRRLGNPQLSCPVIHVAGTKGKGSVCTFTSSILASAGYRVGIYTSPHLERINQRIRFSGSDIDDDQLIRTLQKIDPAVSQMDAEAAAGGTKPLTFFEIITAAGFQFFADQRANIVTLEVGMGGRLDSTNICQPDICVITNISLDHTKQLGTTTAEIAAEKAGIIKPGVPVVCGAQDSEAKRVIHDIAAEKGCEVFQLGRDFQIKSCEELFEFTASIGETSVIENLRPSLLGAHQHENAAIAMAACLLLNCGKSKSSRDWQIRPEHFRSGVAAAHLPGRCEIIQPEFAATNFILDIAHNEASTTALADTLRSGLPDFATSDHCCLIFAASREKDVAAMLKPLLPLFNRVIITKYADNPRGRKIGEVVAIAEKIVADDQLDLKIETATGPHAAINSLDAEIRNESNEKPWVCVTGSAFLVAELRPLLLAKTRINR